MQIKPVRNPVWAPDAAAMARVLGGQGSAKAAYDCTGCHNCGGSMCNCPWKQEPLLGLKPPSSLHGVRS